MAIANFVVIYQTASSSDVIVYPAGGVVTFQDGQNVSLITVTVVSDGIPELDETLIVRLTSLSGNQVVGELFFLGSNCPTFNPLVSLLSAGDAVLVPPTSATLLIPYNDYPNGLFQFAADSRALVANEGAFLTLK